jgi:hypothetical protein
MKGRINNGPACNPFLELYMEFSKSADIKAPRRNNICWFFETKKKEEGYGDSTLYLGTS